MAATLSYYPSKQSASRFWDAQHNKEQVATRVPNGFPEKLHSPLAWTRAQIIEQRSEWVVELGQDDIEAIEAALTSFEGKASGTIPTSSLTTTDTPSSITRFIRNFERDVCPSQDACSAPQTGLEPGLQWVWLQHHSRS